ncbi:MAG TPA: TetR/AcrR family transcriptional regulator [Acetobacteraceae bacterium]|nr:TetR/AcrR family transcriptional regulator [Acetobacteraceae bacterium]
MKPRPWPASLAASAALRQSKRPSWRTGVQERRRDALLDAAEQFFAEKGLLEASLQEIGEAIGLPPYAVRAQFGNREMIIEAVLDRHVDRLIDRIGLYQKSTEAAGPADRLRLAIGHLLDMLWAYRHAQRVHVAAMSGASPHLTRTLKLRQRHLVHFLAGLIADAVPEAEGRSELAMPVALSLMGMACWHVLWFRDMGALSRAEYARLLTHMVIDGTCAAAAAGLGGWEGSGPAVQDAG